VLSPIEIMEFIYYILLVILVLAQMLRTNFTLTKINTHLESLCDRQAIVIIPSVLEDIDPNVLADAPTGSLVDLVTEWDLGE
jgi:hypothetical protein|tara:strand:+ start:3603 stop:3848 length:246 start_codon:yes stop_codon:yes gene_type:complete